MLWVTGADPGFWKEGGRASSDGASQQIEQDPGTIAIYSTQSAPPVGVYISQQVEQDPGTIAIYSTQSAPPVGVYISQQIGTIAI